jgi:putative ABC transport system permease protein
MRVIEGSWWSSEPGAPAISVGEGAARRLKIGVGSTLEFLSSGRTVTGKVANLRETEFSRPGSNNQFIFSPGSLDGLSASYVGNIRARPSAIPSLQRDLYTHAPNVTAIDVGQILDTVQKLLDQVSNVIRFISAFAILGGILILASSVMATRFQRVREAVLLKTLGATRAQVVRIQAAEFLILGGFAGAIGCLLAAAAANYLLGTELETDFTFRWIPMMIGTVGTAAVAVATGWISSRGILDHKPLEVLREN